LGEHKRRGRRTSEYWVGLGRQLRAGLFGGLGFAAIYCAYVAVLFALRGPVPFERRETTLPAVLATYVASGLLGGFVFGFLYPLRRSLPGQLVVATVIATLVFLNINIARNGFPTGWTRQDWEPVFVLGGLFGIVGTVAMRRSNGQP
jgi:hypothetical protein